MYKVLLIDDNPMTVEALYSTVNWEELGLTVAGKAYDGVDGCRMISEIKPDIIVTDIHMPDIDGLSMIEKMEEELDRTRVIFITGYDRFQYASRAIKLSAFDFIVKPINNDELKDSLKRAVASLDKEKDKENKNEMVNAAAKRIQFISELTAGSCRSTVDFGGFLDAIPESYFFIAVENDTGISRPLLQRLDYISMPKGIETISAVIDGELIIFCAISEENAEWENLARRVAETLIDQLMNVTIAVSACHQSSEEFKKGFEECRQTLLWHNIYGRHADIEFFGQQIHDNAKYAKVAELEQMCGKLALKIDEYSAEEIWSIIEEKSMKKLRVIKLMLMFLCTKVTQEKIAHMQWDDSFVYTVYDISKLNDEEQAQKWLYHFVEEVERIRVPVNSALVCNVLNYVKTHVTEGLMLEDVAAEFFVSPNYLSTLIRKETGVTYRQHVIEAKINVAKHMLDDTRMRVEDIAYAIGYENYISFYNVFKKIENISPTDYRFRSQNAV